MKYSTALRAEFAIPGAATVLCGAWLLGAVGWLFGRDPLPALFERLPFGPNGSVAAVLALVGGVGLTYGVGVCVVMTTYQWPTKPAAEHLRTRRLNHYRRLSSGPDAVRTKAAVLAGMFTGAPTDDGTTRCRRPSRLQRLRAWFADPDRWWNVLRDPTPVIEGQGTMLTMSRSTLTGPTQDHVEYRLGTRQIAAGLLPAALMATAVAAITNWEHYNLDPTTGWLLRVAGVTVGLSLACSLMATLCYQERVAQDVLIDTAWMLWTETADAQAPATGPGAGHAHLSVVSATPEAVTVDAETADSVSADPPLDDPAPMGIAPVVELEACAEVPEPAPEPTTQERPDVGELAVTPTRAAEDADADDAPAADDGSAA